MTTLPRAALRAVLCLCWPAMALAGAADTPPAPGAAGPAGEVIYTSMRSGSSQIFRADADGTAEVRLTSTEHSELQPVWSRQGRIAFVSTRSGGGDVYTMDAQGGDLRRVTARPGLEQSPAWSPDGQQIAYIADGERGTELRVVRADGSGDRRIAADLQELGAPEWSPDGSRIALVAQIGGKSRVVVADLASGTVQPVTDSKGGEFGPVWTPDGRGIVYVHAGGRTEGVNLRRVQLGNPASVALTEGAYVSSQPRFSPDGTKLLYLSNASSQGGVMNVHLMNADGSGIVNLTRWEHADMGASWSADGRHVFLMSFRDWPGQIYRIGTDGSGLQRLTRSASQEGFPIGRPAAALLAAAGTR